MVAIFAASTKGEGMTITFPDVCKVPAPPAPFVPIPYPNIAYQENMKKANETDAKTKTGSKEAQYKQKQAIDNLFSQTGIKATSATQAVMLGKTAHGTLATKEGAATEAAYQTRSYTTMSNVLKASYDTASSTIKNTR